MSTYLWVNLGAISIPLLFSLTKWFPFHKEWKYFFPACVAMAIPFLAWDIWFTDMAIWGFNPDHLQGIYLWGLPLEEYLFFICIPYACVFTYFVLYQRCTKIQLYAHKVLIILAAVLLFIAAIVHDRMYPAVTFVCLGVFLLLITARKRQYLDHFLAMYLITLLPFFIVNGILTGSWIEEPVVWYNDQENLGIRLGTIPIEDTMYGMLMLIMTVSGMEWLKRRAQDH